METTPKSRPWFVILPLLLMLLLASVSSIRKLAISQVKLVFVSRHAYAWALREQGVKAEELPESDPGEEQRTVRAYSSARPQDYQIQLAYSLLAEWSHAINTPDDRVKRLDALAGEFPSRATVYAHMLRYETEREVRVRRQTEYEFVVKQTEKDDIKVDPDELRPPTDLGKHIDEYERYAIAGEKLEPNNAYFNLMHAVSQLASHRDDEAIASIKAASVKTDYDDHVTDELQADWRLTSEAFGDYSPALRAVIQGGVKSPHLEQLAAMGRAAVTIAVKFELAKRTEEGISLRIAMAHCGKLIRSRSHSIPSAITGCDITSEQIYRPGGAPLIAEDVNLSKSEREQQKYDAYYNFLTKNKHGDEVTWMRNELPSIAKVRDIQKGVADVSLSPYGRQGLKVTFWWIVDCILLLNVMYVVVPVLAIALFSFNNGPKPATLMIVLIGAYALAIVLAFQSDWASAISTVRTQFSEWIIHNSGTSDLQVRALSDRVFDLSNLHSAILFLALATPLLLFALVYIQSRKTDIIYIDSIKLDFIPIGSMIACATMIIYCFALFVTIRQETRLHSELDQVMVNEGKFLAPMIGQQWPD